MRSSRLNEYLMSLALVIFMAFGSPMAGQTSPFQRQLSVEELEVALSSDDWVVVDARSSDEFNGWALGEIKQGGHIAGAVDFSAAWLRVEVPDREERLKQILQAKKILQNKNIAIYGIEETDRMRVAKYLHRLNFKRLYAFDLNDWIESNRELKRYPQYQRLLPPVIVKKLLDGKVPATFTSAKRVKFVEVSWGDESASYAKGHVPGSFHINTDHFEPPPTWYLGNPKLLTKFAADYGFHKDDTVIVSSDDVLASYRLAVVLEYIGISDVRVLNGGSKAWTRAGFPLETARHDPPNANGFGAEIPGNEELVLTTEMVKKKRAEESKFTLVDTRSWAEFVGETSGYSYHKFKGRIPGSVYGQADEKGSDSMATYRNIDGTMRNPDEIRAVWKKAGIDTDHRLCFLCGGGWRAAEVFTFARVMGIDESTLYSDGWIGWSNDKSNAVETGPPK